jgi:hypothetical protein
LADGARQANGSTPVFNSLGGWGYDNSSNNQKIVASNFGNCDAYNYPRFAGSAKVVQVDGTKARLSTGHVIAYGSCTQGKDLIKIGNEVQIDGIINVSEKKIDAYNVKVTLLK